MFSRATSLLLAEIDPDGSLIAVQRLNDADKLDPLAIVIKRRPSRLWFWQRTKYRPTGFSLNDVLKTGQRVDTEVKEVDFLKYSGTFEDKGAASLEAETGSVFKAGLEGKGSSKLQCNFGSLKKKEVDIRSLVQNSQNKQLNLEYPLLSQLRRGRRSVCVCVRECVFNTQECVVSEEQEESGSCSSILGLTPAKIKVSVKQSGSLESDNDVSLTIPACTTLAYSVIELEVDHTGQYELCLVQELKGGFEVDGPGEETPHLNSMHTHDSIQKELECVCVQLSPLGGEQVDTRTALLRLLCDIINMGQQSEALDTLEMALEDVCDGETPDLASADDDLKTKISSLLKLLPHTHTPDTHTPDTHTPDTHTPDTHTPDTNTPDTHTPLTAMHLLVSALDVMSPEALSALSSCSSPPVLKDLHQMVLGLLSEGACSPLSPALQHEEVYKHAAILFAASDVSLQREAGSVKICSDGPMTGHLPLVMAVAVTGLALLADGK